MIMVRALHNSEQFQRGFEIEGLETKNSPPLWQCPQQAIFITYFKAEMVSFGSLRMNFGELDSPMTPIMEEKECESGCTPRK
jgi:hypothetical protein